MLIKVKVVTHNSPPEGSLRSCLRSPNSPRSPHSVAYSVSPGEVFFDAPPTSTHATAAAYREHPQPVAQSSPFHRTPSLPLSPKRTINVYVPRSIRSRTVSSVRSTDTSTDSITRQTRPFLGSSQRSSSTPPTTTATQTTHASRVTSPTTTRRSCSPYRSSPISPSFVTPTSQPFTTPTVTPLIKLQSSEGRSRSKIRRQLSNG